MTTPRGDLKRKTAPAPENYRYHEVHCEGDVRLESNDGVIFRVSSKDLKRSGTFFTDILSVPKPTPAKRSRQVTCRSVLSVEDNDGTIIEGKSPHIDTPSPVLTVLIDLCKVSDPFLPNTSFQHTLELYRLCDKYRLNQAIQDKVKEHLHAVAGGDPWNLLIAAAEVKDVPRARTALQAMSTYDFYSSVQDMGPIRAMSVWERLERLPPAWTRSVCSRVFRERSMPLPFHQQITAANTITTRGRETVLATGEWPDWTTWTP